MRGGPRRQAAAHRRPDSPIQPSLYLTTRKISRHAESATRQRPDHAGALAAIVIKVIERAAKAADDQQQGDDDDDPDQCILALVNQAWRASLVQGPARCQ